MKIKVVVRHSGLKQSPDCLIGRCAGSRGGLLAFEGSARYVLVLVHDHTVPQFSFELVRLYQCHFCADTLAKSRQRGFLQMPQCLHGIVFGSVPLASYNTKRPSILSSQFGREVTYIGYSLELCSSLLKPSSSAGPSGF